MKKIVAIILIIVAIATVAYADAPDLSSLTYDQLIALQHYITAEIMSRPEWKEVAIPSGMWTVGVDIPAGVYSVHPGDSGGGYVTFYDEKGYPYMFDGIRKESDSIGKVEVKEGYQVEVTRGNIKLAPPISLGF